MKHSVALDYKKCRGCTSCIKACPTQAIRVRRGKAMILADRCIDCGTCIRVCPHYAIKTISDERKVLEDYEYRVAVVSPTLYGQFQHLDDIDVVLNGLLKIGFDDVYEVAKAAEYLSDMDRQKILAGEIEVAPRISSACPAVTRLICLRFPKLIPNIMPSIMPMELAAILARKGAVEKTGLPAEKIGVIAIVPCPSQITSVFSPVYLKEPVLDGAFSVRDIYMDLLTPMRKLEEIKPMVSAGITGISRAYCGGESAARLGQRYLAVDGIENVIRMLEEIEDGRLPEADFIELSACVKGCVGGCLTVENPFGTHMRMKELMKGLPVSRNRWSDLDEDPQIFLGDKSLEYVPALQLDTDRAAAMEKLLKIQEMVEHLPGLHCGSCGAPSCSAFAEDVVLGRASEDDCIFKVRERMKAMAGTADSDNYLPAPFRRQQVEHGAPPEIHSLR